MKYILISFISFALLSSCNKEDDNNEFEFVFGGYAGECFGNCANFYLLTEDELYADDFEYFTHTVDDFKFQTNPLDNNKYQLAKAFYNDMPTALIESEESVFGIPDAYDQGGFFITLKTPGDSLISWNIDTNREVLPEYLKIYMDKLETLLGQL